MQSMVLSRESISSVYAIVIPVPPLFATSSFTQSTGIHLDTVIGTAPRRACGASCIRLLGLIFVHLHVLSLHLASLGFFRGHVVPVFSIVLV